MENLIMLLLIETYRMQDSLLHEDESWNCQFAGETDKKFPHEWVDELAEAVVDHKKTYLDARSEIEQALRKCPFEKDEILIKKLMKPNPQTNLLPETTLKSLRDQIMFYFLDTLILDSLSYKRHNRTYHIKDLSQTMSPRLARDIAQHNRNIKNVRWLKTFFYCPPRWA